MWGHEPAARNSSEKGVYNRLRLSIPRKKSDVELNWRLAVITESADRAAARSKAHTRRWIMLGVVVAIALFAVGYYKFQSQAREARRQPVLHEIGRLEAAERNIAKIATEHDKISTAFDNAKNAAGAAGKARHDNGLSPDASTETNLEFAQKELDSVEKMQSGVAQLRDVYDREADTFDEVLGDDTVSKFRSDAQTYTSELAVSAADWQRAAMAIVDSDKVELNGGSGDTSETEHEYQLTSEEEARADSSFIVLDADWRKLGTQLAGRLHNARVALGKT
jgi:hypothetical protein